ncbi:MAG: nucleotide kinase [Clostridia bacterium]
MKNLYIIGGTMGVGKTAVCQSLKQKLSNAVFLDGDWCWDANLSNLDRVNCNTKLIALTCDANTLKERLEKDISNGVRNREVLERSVARIPLYDKLNATKIDTNGRSVNEIADEIAAL